MPPIPRMKHWCPWDRRAAARVQDKPSVVERAEKGGWHGREVTLMAYNRIPGA